MTTLLAVHYSASNNRYIYRNVDLAGWTLQASYESSPRPGLTALRIAPDLTTIYTHGITSGGISRFARSLDAGLTWTTVSIVSTENIGYIEPDAVVAGTAWGAGWNDPTTIAKIYKTTDYGDTWTAKLSVATSLGSISGQRVVPHPNGTTLFALITDATGGIGNSRMYVYRSDDGGENWAQKINTIPTTSGVSGHISLDRAGNRLLVTGYYALDTRNVYESMDQGDSWSNLGDIASVRFSGAPTPNSDGVFLANVQEQPAGADFLHSIYRSLAPGSAFADMGDLAVGDSIVKAVSTIATDFAFAVPQGNPSVFYALNNSAVAGIPGRIYNSVDGGSSWTVYDEQSGFDWTALAVIEDVVSDDRLTFLSLKRRGGKVLV